MSIRKKEFYLSLFYLSLKTKLEELLNCFDNCTVLKINLKGNEVFYFERRIENGYYTSQEIEDMGLKLHSIFGCVRKPYKTEDFLEVKALGRDGRIRFLIWCADIFFKYNIVVPDIIRQKVLTLAKFDVISRHNKPMEFMKNAKMA